MNQYTCGPRPVTRKLLATACLAFFLVGCGPPGLATAPVRGKVTYNGRPVPNGTVITRPEGDKPSATGEIKSDGSYELTTYSPGDGAVLGKHAVMIMAVEDSSGKLPEERSATPALIVPRKYTSFDASGLSIEVTQGQNTYDFELTK